MLQEKSEDVFNWTEQRCFCFYDKYFTKENADIIKKAGFPTRIMRDHIRTIIEYYIPSNEPRKRTGRVFNKTRNQISLCAWNIRKLAKEGYYDKPFDNEQLLKINTRILLYHPIMLFVTQAGTYYKRLNHSKGKESTGITYYQSHKASRIRSKAKEGYYGHGLDQLILELSTEDLIQHAIFNVGKSITKNRKDDIVKKIMGVK